MKSNIPDDPDEIYRQLSKVCATAYEGLLIGADKVREIFEQWDRDINLVVATNIARYHAKMHLAESVGINSPYSIEQVPSNGISIVHGVYRLRVLKGRNGTPPLAANTERSQNFFNQSLPGQLTQRTLAEQLLLPNIDWRKLPEAVLSLNLIICWEVDSSFDISKVQLFCPRDSGTYRDGVKLHWRRGIPHPLEVITSTPSLNDQDNPDDLEIFFDDADAQE